MQQTIQKVESVYRKRALPAVQSGDTVQVHQTIREGNKSRIQVFEGIVIRTKRAGELTATITVRRIASGIGVEKTFLLHSPNINKVEVMRRSRVRRNFLSYLRGRRGKAARLQEMDFDRSAVNVADEPKPETVDQSAQDEPAEPATSEPKEPVEVEAAVAASNPDDATVPADDVAPVASTDEVAAKESEIAAADDATADPNDESALEQVEAESKTDDTAGE